MIKATRLTAERIAEHGHDWAGELIDASLQRRAATEGDAIAIIDPRRSITVAELERDVARFAGALRDLGVGRGDAVTWQLPNWIEAAVVHLAILRIGAVSNPVVPIFRASEVAFVLEQTEAKVMVVAESFRKFDYPSMLAEVRAEVPTLETVVVVGEATRDYEHSYDSMLEREPVPPEPSREPGDIALLLYTSGTTAAPKGALHTHDTLDYELRSVIDFFDLGPADSLFMPSPVTHVTGVLYGVHLSLANSAPLVFLDIWDPLAALKLMSEHGSTFMAGATPFLHGLINHPSFDEYDLRPLRVYPCGGADVSPSLINLARERLDCLIARMYGSTELPSVSCSNTEDPVEKWAETDGRLMGKARMRLLDEEGGEVPPGIVGEIEVTGPELFVGYLDPGATAESFTEDGWFKTGDLGVVDADGFLTITGRKKDIILRGGENISAKEIEGHLEGHPAIAEVAVVGMPDPVLVERVCAFVVSRDGETLELDDIVSFLRERRIANQKLPERLEMIPNLPRTPSGKVKKFELREMLDSNLRRPA